MMSQEPRTEAGAGTGAECPVCGMEVAPGASPDSLPYDGTTYSFCDRVCRDRFQARPGFYLARRSEGLRTPVMLG